MSAPAQSAAGSGRAQAGPVAELRGVSKQFKIRLPQGRQGTLRAVDSVDLAVAPGTTLGLVGESGSGKSTVARLLLRLADPTTGRVYLNGRDITNLQGRALRGLRRHMQLVFQDPYSSFDPRVSIKASITEALRTTDIDRPAMRARTLELLDMVGLGPTLAQRHPPQLSGGQLQRAAIARALAVGPLLMALDEPLSSLDVSSQAHITNLLEHLQDELGVAYLFITHDLTAARDISHNIAVMYLGQIVETGPTTHIYKNPRHPYTQALLSAAPHIDAHPDHTTRRIALHGDIPSAMNPPQGCRFHTRCPHSTDICRQQQPPPTTTPDGTTVTCHLHTTTEPGLTASGAAS